MESEKQLSGRGGKLRCQLSALYRQLAVSMNKSKRWSSRYLLSKGRRSEALANARSCLEDALRRLAEFRNSEAAVDELKVALYKANCDWDGYEDFLVKFYRSLALYSRNEQWLTFHNLLNMMWCLYPRKCLKGLSILECIAKVNDPEEFVSLSIPSIPGSPYDKIKKEGWDGEWVVGVCKPFKGKHWADRSLQCMEAVAAFGLRSGAAFGFAFVEDASAAKLVRRIVASWAKWPQVLPDVIYTEGADPFFDDCGNSVLQPMLNKLAITHKPWNNDIAKRFNALIEDSSWNIALLDNVLSEKVPPSWASIIMR